MYNCWIRKSDYAQWFVAENRCWRRNSSAGLKRRKWTENICFARKCAGLQGRWINKCRIKRGTTVSTTVHAQCSCLQGHNSAPFLGSPPSHYPIHLFHHRRREWRGVNSYCMRRQKESFNSSNSNSSNNSSSNSSSSSSNNSNSSSSNHHHPWESWSSYLSHLKLLTFLLLNTLILHQDTLHATQGQWLSGSAKTHEKIDNAPTKTNNQVFTRIRTQHYQILNLRFIGSKPF